MKKILKSFSVLLIFIVLISSFSVSAAYTVDGWDGLVISDDIKNDGTWFYELDEKTKTAKICGYMGQDKDVVIPEIIDDGYTVTELVLNTAGMNEQLPFPIFGTQKYFETLTLPKTIQLISNYFSEEYYNSLELSATEIKNLRERLERELKCNGQVIMRGYFYSEPLHNLKAFIVDEENPYFSSKDGVLYNKDQSILIQYPWGKSEEKFVIPQTVTQIMDYAIKGHAGIEEIVITENVNKLGLHSIGGSSNYIEYDSGAPGSFIAREKLPMPRITILNNTLDEEQLVYTSLFQSWFSEEAKFEITVYKDSPADKALSSWSESSDFDHIEIVKRLDNPYIEETEEKEEIEPQGNSNDEALSPQTSDKTTVALIVALLISVGALCVLLPKFKKKKQV